MKRNIFKFTAYVVLVVFTTLQIAWAEEPVPIPCVTQLPPEGLRPVTHPNWLIEDKLNLPGPQSVPVTSLGFPQTSLDFLAGSKTLSTGESVSINLPPPPDIQAVPPIEDKPFQFTGLSNSIHLTRKEEKKEEKDASKRHPGITTGNLKDLITDAKPLRNPEDEIESPSLEPPPLEKVSASLVFSKKEKHTKEVSKKEKVRKRDWRERKRKGGGR